MIQQGQVFKLKAKSADGQPLWAYRYRVLERLHARARGGRRALLRRQGRGRSVGTRVRRRAREVLRAGCRDARRVGAGLAGGALVG